MDKSTSKREPGQPQRGPLPDPSKSARVKCATPDCPEIVVVKGGRLAAYRSKGTIPYHSQECRRTAAVAWVEGPCACGCGETWRKYRSEVKKITTGRIFVDATHAIGQGTKPRRGNDGKCEGCGEEMYLQPSQVGKKRFHSNECRRLAEAKTLIAKTCPACGAEFTVLPSKAGAVYDTAYCRRVGMMTRAIPGAEHNGLPKRWDDKGYVLVYEPQHPGSGKYGWVYEHRLVAERELVHRYLAPYEEVNHIDEVKDNNDPSNLEVLDKRSHASITGRSVQNRRRAAMAELEEYRRRFGALPADAQDDEDGAEGGAA